MKVSNTLRLAKIQEDPEELDEEAFKKIPSTEKNSKNSLILPSFSLEKTISQVSYFKEWLWTLKLHPLIYSNFVNRATTQQILSIIPKNPSHLSLRSNMYIKLPSSSLSKPSLLKKSSKSLTKRLKQPFDWLEKNSPKTKISISNVPSRLSRLSILPKLLIIDKKTPGLLEKFKEIAGSEELTKENFKKFLALRYPNEFLESVLKFTFHGPANFDGWVLGLQRFVSLPDDKHKKIAFSIYDLNKDKVICYNDTFRALTMENCSFFEKDLVEIQNQLMLKSRKQEENQKTIKSKKIYSETLKIEGLSFEEFSQIKFSNGKPQIIIDIISYITGFDLTGTSSNLLQCPIKRKKSEEIIFEMWKTPGFRESLISDSNFLYFSELEEAFKLFHPTQTDALLLKFNEMVCSSYNSNFLSLNSITEHFPKFFGVDNCFISESFYNLLSGVENFNINKLRFMQKMKTLFDVIFN